MRQHRIRAEALKVEELGAGANTQVDQHHVGLPASIVGRGLTNVGDRTHAIAVHLQLHPVHLGDIGIAGDQQNVAALFAHVRNGVDHQSIVIIRSEMGVRAAHKSVKRSCRTMLLNGRVDWRPQA